MAWDQSNPSNPWKDSWTSTNGLTTTGTQNPFGLKTNSTGGVIDPYTGYNADPQKPALANTVADNSGNSFPTLGGTPQSGNSATSNDPLFGPLINNNKVADNYQWTPNNSNIGPVSALINNNKVADNYTWTPNGTSTPNGNPTLGATPASGNSTVQPNTSTQPNTNPYIAPATQASYDKDLYGNKIGMPQSQPNNTAPNNGQTPFSFYQDGLTADPLFPNGQPVNPTQFATPQSAQDIAKLLGGYAQGGNITSAGGAFTNDQQSIVFPNGFKVNAGLVANLINTQGLEAAKKVIERDMSSFGQAPPTDSRNLNLQQPLPVGGGNNSGANGGGDFMSQLLGLYALLQKLGIGVQRPPALSGTNSNSNYFSQFA